MEVSGRKQLSNNKTAKADILCQTCQDNGRSVTADGYCTTCHAFLCRSCIDAHRKSTGTKNHEIKIPVVQDQSDPCTELCVNHISEVVSFYCKYHDCVGCGECMILEHKTCNVRLVSDVSSYYDTSKELVRIKHIIQNLNENIISCKQEIRQRLKTATEMKKNAVEELKTFRKDFDKYLNQVEADLLEEIEQMNASDVSHQKELQGECESMENEMNELQIKLEQYSEKVNQFFVTSKLGLKRLQEFQEINKDIASKSQINIYEFDPSKDLTALQMNCCPLGNISSRKKNSKSTIEMKAHFVKKVKAEAPYEGLCWITGMTMLSCDELLLADNNRRSLKILNVSKNKVTSRFKPPGQPWDVTVINPETAAATIGDQGKILFLNTKNGLSESHSLQVKKWCSGIDYHSGKLVVSFVKHPAVQVLDIEGHVLHEFSDMSVLKQPSYVAINKDNESILVSDYYNNSVHELTLDAHLKATIKSQILNYPEGLAVTRNGTIIVCSPDNSDSVSMIVPGTTRKILPLFVSNVKVPRCILICEEQRKMYICEHERSKDSNYIKIFDLKED